MSEKSCPFCGAMPNPDGMTITHAYDPANRVHCPGQLGFSDEQHRMEYETWWLNEYGPRGLQNSLADIRENGT